MTTSFITQERQLVQPDSSAFVADPELIRVLEAKSSPIICATDKILFNQDDPVVGIYIFHRGAATLTMKSIDGRVIFSIPAMPGSLLGLPALISNKPYSISAIAHPGSEISFVGHDDFFSLVQSDPQLSLKMLQLLAAEVRTARQALGQ